MMNSRSTYNVIFGMIAAVAALWSLALGLCYDPEFAKANAKYIVGLWVVLPPIFFWVDWVVFCRKMTKDDLDAVKHTHDLSRNIWLALITVLVVLFKLEGLFKP